LFVAAAIESDPMFALIEAVEPAREKADEAHAILERLLDQFYATIAGAPPMLLKKTNRLYPLPLPAGSTSCLDDDLERLRARRPPEGIIGIQDTIERKEILNRRRKMTLHFPNASRNYIRHDTASALGP
jgi:hypothetical protein